MHEQIRTLLALDYTHKNHDLICGLAHYAYKNKFKIEAFLKTSSNDDWEELAPVYRHLLNVYKRRIH